MNSENKSFPLPKEPFTFLFSAGYPLFTSRCSISLTEHTDVVGVWNEYIIYHFVKGYVTAYGSMSSIKKAREEGDKLLNQEIFENHVNYPRPKGRSVNG